jgi:hypothetical protein
MVDNKNVYMNEKYKKSGDVMKKIINGIVNKILMK